MTELVTMVEELASGYQTNTKHLFNIFYKAAQRLRRWSNIVQMLYKCFVLAE